MKKELLRIGNTVYYDNRAHTLIDSDFLRLNFEKLAPIPLTEQTAKWFDIEWKPMNILSSSHFDIENFRFYLNDDDGVSLHYANEKSGFYPRIKDIEFVHEFQNLFIDLAGKPLAFAGQGNIQTPIVNPEIEKA